MYDVIVIGAGPVGCYAASLLAKRGLDVLVLEKNPSVGHQVVCAGLIGVEAFDRFRLPTSSVINRIRDVNFFSPSGLHLLYRADQPMAFVVDRREFDRDMADMAMSSGANLRCSSLVTGIRIHDDGAVVEVQGSEGQYDLRAGMAVVAGGFDPRITRNLGLDGPTEWLQGAEAELEVNGVSTTEIYVGRDIAPGSFAWMVPLNHERAKIGVTTGKHADQFLQSFLDSPMIRGRIKTNNPTVNVDLIPIKPIRKSFTERVLVVGEAAGQVKSTTCGGIYYGLISAECASETIEEAFSEGRFDEGKLKRYEKKWREELGQELEVGYHLRQVFSGIEDRQIDRLFEILNSDGILSLIHRVARFDWHKDLILMLSGHPSLRKYLHPISMLAKRLGSEKKKVFSH
jgi:digeranylgeranylglycerophospholipid reductase